MKRSVGTMRRRLAATQRSTETTVRRVATTPRRVPTAHRLVETTLGSSRASSRSFGNAKRPAKIAERCPEISHPSRTLQKSTREPTGFEGDRACTE
jgi:hypothetical protein